MLRNALLEAPTTPEDRIAQERMRDMHDLIELTGGWFDDVQRLDRRTLTQLLKMGAKVQRLLEFTTPAGARAAASRTAGTATTNTNNTHTTKG
jgi:DNA-binding transcriptional regulator GbsR (MarR family)